jgi:NitT/TauT family transport system permease protein
MRAFFAAYFAPKTEIPRRVYLSASGLTGLSVAGGWCLLTYGGMVRLDFLPPPHAVLLVAYEWLADGSLIRHAWSSVFVIISGFVLASVLSVPLGILMGSFKIVEAAVEPITNFVRYLPVSALIPLLILWIGIGVEQKIAVIFLGTFFQQVILIADVSGGVSRDMVDVSYTLGANRRHVVTRVLIPATLPGVMDTLRVGGRAGGGQQRPRLHDPERDARAVHRRDLPRHPHHRLPGTPDRPAVQDPAPLAAAVGGAGLTRGFQGRSLGPHRGLPLSQSRAIGLEAQCAGLPV